MLKFIWNSWWRNKERFILLLVGVLIVSTGLSYLIGATQANNGTVVDELQKRWQSSYHLVVRPDGSRSVTEELNLLEPNYLSGLEGGITLEQYEQIKAMADVEIAAPIAMMGSIRTNVDLDEINIQEPGVYRMNIHEETDTGAGTEVFEGNQYITVGGWQPEGLGKEYGATPNYGNLTYGSSVMVAGIDPEAESALVGLDQAMITAENSRFFNDTDSIFEEDIGGGGLKDYHIPVIVSNRDYVDAQMTYSFEKLELPFSPEEQFETMEYVKKNGGEAFLEKQEGTPVKEFVYTTADVHQKLVDKVFDPSLGSGSFLENFAYMRLKPSPITYQPVKSPFGDRWPYSYQVEPYRVPEDSRLAIRHMYRPVNEFGESSDDWPRFQLNYIGVFDPQKLEVSKDPLTELPMETYFPAKAQWVMDVENQPVNPPADMKPVNNANGFLTKPPLILTTIEAAAEVLGEKPISAIRVNVSGVETFNEESEAKLQAVAKLIEDQTGLLTDITLGSSPQLALTHLAGLDNSAALGWVQQPWIKIGSSITIFQETKIGMSGVIASVILVAIVYVFASNIIMLYARKKEFAVLLSLGWRPSQLSKLLLLESTLLGILVGLVSWLILGAFVVTDSIDTSILRVFLIGVSGLAIYWLGSLIPIWLIRRIKPYESMRSGEISQRTKRIVRSSSVLGMSINNLFSQWQRSLLSILAIAVPTSLFIFFLFVTFRLKGVLYATWLGEFVALEVGTMHYVAMAVALLIAVLTTTEIMWQNVSERQAQIVVLKATGWQNNSVRFLILWEGIMTGLIAGIIGMVISLLIIYQVYRQVPVEEFGFLSLTMLIPIVTGVFGALLPAQIATRISTYQAINGTFHNSKKVEKQFKWVIGSFSFCLVVGIFILFLFTIPENTSSTTGNVIESKNESTTGAIASNKTTNAVPKSLEENKIKEKSEDQKGAIEKLQENAYRSYTLGDGTDKNENFRLGKLVETPKGITISNEKNRLISIPVTLEITDSDSQGFYVYKPQGFKIVDNSGKEYSNINMEISEKGQWMNKFKFMLPNKTTVVLTYEIPKDLERVVFTAEGTFVGGMVVVEVVLSE